jgi:two-component system chemotaxis response regulator CheB
MAEKRIRVLVVDDSAFMRKIIGDILAEDARIEVVARARDGEEALRRVVELAPDVVTLDVEMPRKNGLEALRDIMRTRPTPVVMVSSLTREGADVTLQALSAGAVDFIAKPSGTISLDMAKIGDELRQKVLVAGSVNPGGLPEDRRSPQTPGALRLGESAFPPFRPLRLPPRPYPLFRYCPRLRPGVRGGPRWWSSPPPRGAPARSRR